ncbi:MAG: HEAT repeat domain-containing protein [Armatimonadota bacterium]
MRIHLATCRAVIYSMMLLCLAGGALAWVQESSPLNDGRLIIVKPAEFTDAAGKAVTPVNVGGALFGGTVKIDDQVQAPARVQSAGQYTLWVRVAEDRPQWPLTVEFMQAKKALLSGVVNNGPGAPGKGGAAAFEAYRNEAAMRNAEGGADPGDDLLEGGGGIGDILNEITQEANPELRWVNSSRIEKQDGFYWWKVGSVDLAPGRYTLRISGGPGRCNAAFLTTASHLTYPFGGDLDIPPASYIRFRVDALPRGGAKLSASLRIHANPYFNTSTGYFSESAMTEQPDDPIKQTGYTAWYRLQDLEHAPGFGGAGCHLLLSVPKGAKGATQFAVFPHPDMVLREIAWDEPEGTTISMRTDFAAHLSSLRTFLDHAREHYDYALRANGGRMYPLMRTGRYFGTNVRGSDGSGDYVSKTLRLLGTNSNGDRDDANRRRYGWFGQTGGGWVRGPVPFNEEKARAWYADRFERDYAPGDDYQSIVSWYLADEPGEAATTAITAPFWRYYGKDRGGPKWVDYAGGSDLLTKRTDLSNCVLEGKVLKLGGAVSFHVGFSDVEQPTDGMVWTVGRVSENRYDTLMVAKPDGSGGHIYKKPEATISDTTPTPFKLLYENGAAALFLNGKLIQYETGLNPRGGFRLTGGPKAFTELTLRPLRKEERGVAGGPEMAEPDIEGAGVGDLFADDEEHPDWATPKPLEQFVKDDWVVGGGIPEAHAGFRKWLAAQGVKPELFGKKAWDEISPLTIKELAETETDRRLYYWGRRYAGYLTPKMFSIAAEAMRDAFPNKDIKAIVALSGHSLYFPSAMPLDMFALASYGGALAPGISDFMSNGLRWDSQQAIAFSIAPYHSGARVYPEEAPAGWPADAMGPLPRAPVMMHCGWSAPTFNAYVQLANDVRFMSYYHFGPEYIATEWYWSENPGAYVGPHKMGNRAAQVDDILSPARMRPSRVAMLYARSTEYWHAQASFADKRAGFLGLSHEYYQPELVTEEQVSAGALDHYDALYVLEPWVSDATQANIKAFVERGGLLWTCADALRWNEYQEPSDFLQRAYGLQRTYTEEARDTMLVPAAGERNIRKQDTPKTPVDTVDWKGATVRARFADGRPAWLEKPVGKGRVVYLAFRAGINYTNKAVRVNGAEVVWGDSGRAPLTLPLNEAKINRELILSQPNIMAQPLTSDTGTVIVLYNMQGNTARDVTIRLKAKKAPVRVQTFDDMTLVDQPFTFKDGWVEMTMPALVREQMIAVHETPAPADDRLQQMQARATELLASQDWEDLTAGAWFAGFYPEWKLADRIMPLLAHENGMVRRAAAEALGQLKYAPATDMLAARIPQETHPHACAEMLMALAALDDARFPKLAQVALDRPQAYIRMQALRAARDYLSRRRAAGTLTPEQRAFGEQLFAHAVDDLDRRVYGETIPLLAAFDPPRCLAMLRDPATDERFRGALYDIVAGDEALVAEYLNTPPDDRGLIELASRRADDRLVSLLLARLDALTAQNPVGLYRAAERQRNPKLTRTLFAQYANLPEPLKGHATLLLEHTFNARIGNDPDTWTEWLAAEK